MAEPNPSLPTFCRSLRTKRYYISDAPPATYLAEETATTGYWCLQTMGPIGPDDGCAVPGSCAAGRSCFRPIGAAATPRPA